jgi:hypothetical protein
MSKESQRMVTVNLCSELHGPGVGVTAVSRRESCVFSTIQSRLNNDHNFSINIFKILDVVALGVVIIAILIFLKDDVVQSFSTSPLLFIMKQRKHFIREGGGSDTVDTGVVTFWGGIEKAYLEDSELFSVDLSPQSLARNRWKQIFPHLSVEIFPHLSVEYLLGEVYFKRFLTMKQDTKIISNHLFEF